MASRNKMAALWALFCVIGYVSCHATSSSSSSELSDDDDEQSNDIEKAERRALALDNEWQYEGIPIEVGSRRDNDVRIPDLTTTTASTTTTSTTTPTTRKPYPPNSYRYRRIYNPDELAFIEDHKFIAAVLVNKQLWCGAVILDTDKILTAAHCLQLQYNNRFFREYVRMLTVRVGSDNATYGGEVYRVTEIMFHPNYKPQTLEFNAAVLKLHKNMTFDKIESKIENIPFSRVMVVPVNKEITFLGWGSVVGVGGDGGAVLLQKVNLPVYNLNDCQDIYGKDLVTRSNFCAGYITIAKNVCNHDAGGPAVMDGQLVGILSFSAQRCDVTDKPAVFTNVGIIADWLDELMYPSGARDEMSRY